MKVGIITFHHTTNYGATLQAYALSKTIKKWGHHVEIIDYRPKGAVLFYLRQLLPFQNKRLQWNKDFYQHILQAVKMRRFLRSDLQLSPFKCYSNSKLGQLVETAGYDAVVTGSDQVWCLTTKFRQFDPAYFLDFLEDKDSCLKVSYAPSVGGTKTFGNQKDEICDLLGRFDRISVRDWHSADLLREECNIESVKVLDPTFLIGYEDILVPPNAKKPYLLIYNHQGLGELQKRIIEKVSQNRNLEIVSIGSTLKVADRSLVAIEPKAWIGYFKQASYVVTNTFHGTIFSIIFKRDFSVFVGEGKKNKVFDLLALLDLENRIMTDTTNEDRIDTLEIDYDSVYKKLIPSVEKSTAFLSDLFSDTTSATRDWKNYGTHATKSDIDLAEISA